MSAFAELEKAVAESCCGRDTLVKSLRGACWRIRPRARRLAADSNSIAMDVSERNPVRKRLPSDFVAQYQRWYSAGRAILGRNQPDRMPEFIDCYSHTGEDRREHRIKDFIELGYVSEIEQRRLELMLETQAYILAAVPDFVRQSMFDVQLRTYAELMDDELLAARELLKNGFLRPAGVLSGVMLERHLKNLLIRHTPSIRVPVKATLSKVNDLCKDAVYGTITWRKIQHLTDLRNLCSHETGREPTGEEVRELLDGVSAILKTQN